jgi:hypothetical protein
MIPTLTLPTVSAARRSDGMGREINTTCPGCAEELDFYRISETHRIPMDAVYDKDGRAWHEKCLERERMKRASVSVSSVAEAQRLGIKLPDNLLCPDGVKFVHKPPQVIEPEKVSVGLTPVECIKRGRPIESCRTMHISELTEEDARFLLANKVSKMRLGRIYGSYEGVIKKLKEFGLYVPGKRPPFKNLLAKNNDPGQSQEEVDKSMENPKLTPVECVKQGLKIIDAKPMEPTDLTYDDAKFLLDKGYKKAVIQRAYGFLSAATFYYHLEKLGLHEKKKTCELNQMDGKPVLEIHPDKDAANLSSVQHVPGAITVFLAGAVDGIDRKTATRWRRQAAQSLAAAKIQVIDPTDLIDPDVPDPMFVVNPNLASIETADLILIEMNTPGYAYIGTAVDMREAWRMGKPIVVWGTQNRESHYLQFHATTICDTLEEAISVIKGLAIGLKWNKEAV